MSAAVATRSFLTSSPSGGVCGDFMRLLNMKRAASVASEAVLTSLTKPALPRPPAKTWALTTASGLAMPAVASLKATAASSMVEMARPPGTGMP